MTWKPIRGGARDPGRRRLVHALSVPCVLALCACGPARDSSVREDLEQKLQSSSALTRALCGFPLGRYERFQIVALTPQLDGDPSSKTGSGTVHATISGNGGYRCQGRARFSYRYVPTIHSEGSSHGIGITQEAHFETEQFRSTSPDTLLPVLRQRAVPVQVGVPFTVSLGPGWVLPNHAYAYAAVVNITQPGLYRVAPPPGGAPGRFMTRVSELHLADGSRPPERLAGGYVNWTLPAGPTYLIVTNTELEAPVLQFYSEHATR